MEVTSTLEVCKEVYVKSPHQYVHIDEEKLRRFGECVPVEELEASTKDSEVNQEVDNSVKAAVYIAYNAVNFSFYPDQGKARWFVQSQAQDGNTIGKDDEAHAVVHCLHQAQSNNILDLTNGAALASVSVETLSTIFKPHPEAGHLPLLEERTSCLNELGKFYVTLDEKEPVQKLLGLCGTSCLKFVDMLCKHCPCFNDAAVYKPLGKTVAFHKRAQLCASMLHSDGIVAFEDINELTVFADYRLPQLFCQVGIFRYRQDLLKAVKARKPILSHSDQEIEIRAASIYAAKLLRDELLKSGKIKTLTLAQLDYFLWRTAVSLAEDNTSFNQLQYVKNFPFHRCRSCYY